MEENAEIEKIVRLLLLMDTKTLRKVYYLLLYM